MQEDRYSEWVSSTENQQTDDNVLRVFFFRSGSLITAHIPNNNPMWKQKFLT